MIKANAQVIMNWGKIGTLTKAQSTALEQTADALHTEIVQAQVVPFDKGTLQGPAFYQDNSQTSSGTVFLMHSTPYARRLYFHPEYNFKKIENPGAKGKWLEDWINGRHKDFAKNAYAKLYRRLAGT